MPFYYGVKFENREIEKSLENSGKLRPRYAKGDGIALDGGSGGGDDDGGRGGGGNSDYDMQDDDDDDQGTIVSYQCAGSAYLSAATR